MAVMPKPTDSVALVRLPGAADTPGSATQNFFIARDESSPVLFGRGGECRIRFGHLPVADPELTRIAGCFSVIPGRGRVTVECGGSSKARAIEIEEEGKPTFRLAVGAVYGPTSDTFTVLVAASRKWPLIVSTRSAPSLVAGGEPSGPLSIRITGRQSEVLRSFVRPLERGRNEPATHRKVAQEMNFSPATIHNDLSAIYAEMFRVGVPLLEVSDKRVAVSEAYLIHRIQIDVIGNE